MIARIRTVKPEFFRHEGLYELEQETGFPIRVAFAGLWTVADREGRFRWQPRILKLDCLPHDKVDFSRVLDALWTRGFLVKYTSDGEDFGWIPSFTRHQVINNRERESQLPTPDESNISTREARVDDASTTRLKHAQGERNGTEVERKGREQAEIDASPTQGKLIDTEPEKPKRTPPKGKADGLDKHPAIVTAHQHNFLQVSATQMPEIIRRVGDKPADLELWGRVCDKWSLSGFSPKNADTRLKAFEAWKANGGKDPDERRIPYDPAAAARDRDEAERAKRRAASKAADELSGFKP